METLFDKMIAVMATQAQSIAEQTRILEHLNRRLDDMVRTLNENGRINFQLQQQIIDRLESSTADIEALVSNQGGDAEDSLHSIAESMREITVALNLRHIA